MFRLFRPTWDLFRQSYRASILYACSTKALKTLVILPLFLWMFYSIVATRGEQAVGNFDLIAFALSLQGILCLLCWSLVFAGLIIIDQGGLIYLAADAYRGARGTVVSAWRRTLHGLVGIVSRGFSRLALLVLVIGPPLALIHGLFVWMFLWLFNPPLLSRYLLSFGGLGWLVALLAAILLPLAVYLFVRWLFAFHAFFLEKRTMIGAFVRSRALTRGHFWRLFRPILHLQVGVLGLAFVLTLIVGGVNTLVGTLLPEHIETIHVFLLAGVLGLELGLIVLTIEIANVLLVQLVTVLYFEQRRLADEAITAVTAVEEMPESPRNAALRVAALVLIALVALGAATWSLAPQIEAAMIQSQEPVLVTAHRGGAVNAPENTVAAFRQAIADGADFGELDVQETKDGVVVVFHDASMKRVARGKNGAKKIWELTFDELRELDVGSHYSPKFKGEQIPTLEEVIAVAQEGGLKLNIELKVNGHGQDLARKVVDIIQNSEFGDDCIITSINYDILLDVKKLDPSLRRGLIVVGSIGDPLKFDVDFISINRGLCSRSLVDRARRMGKGVHVWTVNTKRDMLDMLDMGVESIITDRPSLLRQIEDERTRSVQLAGIMRRFVGR